LVAFAVLVPRCPTIMSSQAQFKAIGKAAAAPAVQHPHSQTHRRVAAKAQTRATPIPS